MIFFHPGKNSLLNRPMLNIQILFTNYDIITDFLNLFFCSKHFIRIKHWILATFNINKKFNSDSLCAFKVYTCIVRDRVFNFHTPSTFNFQCYFLNKKYTVHPISQPTLNYIKLSSFLIIYLMGSLVVVFVYISNLVMWCQAQWLQYL